MGSVHIWHIDRSGLKFPPRPGPESQGRGLRIITLQIYLIISSDL